MVSRATPPAPPRELPTRCACAAARRRRAGAAACRLCTLRSSTLPLLAALRQAALFDWLTRDNKELRLQIFKFLEASPPAEWRAAL